ncbi:MAG: TrkA family potassium uptake protein [Armatimonadota bacterium]|nr:TrkA family potassium uptake protein [Armatimonadota bacterium]MDR7437050.1 TrkA family potassium uptake protein [Armatimonadota bacterium]MDR7507231.1 TrkA family potassium uptake protein [Armatimonadota bacterium]MDR7508936.1 TrkA family potassium uptake protein [Armatimonadota bacterium]MDR7517444.1 TrkA family potassium uptake protein [Armatimonadota bacterium]
MAGRGCPTSRCGWSGRVGGRGVGRARLLRARRGPGILPGWTVGRRRAMDFAVIGIGRFGSNVVRTLYEMGHNVLAIDKDEDSLRRVQDCCTHAVQLDSTDPEALRAVGITNFDAVVVAIGAGIQESILTTLILKEMGCRKVVSKAVDELQARVLEKVGADQVIRPERDMAVRVARSLASRHVVDLLELSPNLLVEEVSVGQRFEGKTLSDLDLRARYGVNILLLKRDSQILVAPGGETQLRAGDVLVVFGEKQALARLESAL